MITGIFVLGGLIFIYGGFDKFKEPIRIVLPYSVSGVLCFKMTPKLVQANPSPQLNYQVREDGFLEMEENLLQSHRRKLFFRAGDAASPMLQISDDAVIPILTENDAHSGTAYGVYWIGSRESWFKFATLQGKEPFCLGR